MTRLVTVNAPNGSTYRVYFGSDDAVRSISRFNPRGLKLGWPQVWTHHSSRNFGPVLGTVVNLARALQSAGDL